MMITRAEAKPFLETRNNSLDGLKIGLVSLGCSKNLVDSEWMLGLIEEAGGKITAAKDEADVLIVNTCGFILPAQEEAIDTILELSQYKDKGNCRALIVAGCLAQRFAEELAAELPEVDALVGVSEFPDIVAIVNKALKGEKKVAVREPNILYNENWPRKLSTPKHYAYLKIAEGCNNYCSYCTIPMIRGRYKSRSLDSIINEAEALVRIGVKEIILIAQDTTRYGVDIYGTSCLADLLKELAQIPGLVWVRWMYSFPTLINTKLIKVMVDNPKICPYIDLPLQHIDAEILKRMHRPTDPLQIRRLIGDLRNNLPDLALRTTFIVGFPGETEDAFRRLLEFVEEIRFDWVGAFIYSPEQGTAAAQYSDAVPEEVKTNRYNQLMELVQEISLQKRKEWVGKKVDVLVDGISSTKYLGTPKEGIYYGRSKREAPEVDGLVYILKPLNEKLAIGELIPVNIIDAGYYDLIGEAKRESSE